MQLLSKLSQKPLLLIFLSAILLYLPSLTGPFVWDDEQFIYKNQYVQNFDLQKIWTTSTTAGAGVVSSYYRPLTTLSFAIDWQIWQNHPIGFRLTNLWLHALAASMLYLFLKKLTGRSTLSWWLSFIFVIHPLQTESVAYINSRGDSLYVLFGMLGLWLWSLALTKSSYKISIYNLQLVLDRWLLIILSLLSFVLSMLAKEIGIAMLGLYWLTGIYFWLTRSKTQKISVRSLGAGLGLFSLATLTYLYLRFSSVSVSDANIILASYSESYAQLWVRLATFSKILFIYVKLIFWPWPLHMERTTSIVDTLSSPYPWAALSTMILITWVGFKEWQTRKTGFTWLGMLWFLGLLIPVSGIIPVNGLLYQHWLYLPLVGCLLCIYGISQVGQLHRVFNKKLLPLLLSLIVTIWIVLSLHQIYIWNDPIRLYTHVAKYASSARVLNNLAMELSNRGQLTQAIDIYYQSLAMSDNYPQTHHNLANAYAALGKTELAIKEYYRAIELDPNFVFSYPSLINLLKTTGQTSKAEQLQLQWDELASRSQ